MPGPINKNFRFLGLLSVIVVLSAIIGFGIFIFSSNGFISAEVVAIPVMSNYFESGFITPASCGVYGCICTGTDKNGNCVSQSCSTQDYGHSEWGGACSPPPPPPPPPPPLSVSISANPSSIARGQSSTLSWSSSNADSCTLYEQPGGTPPDHNLGGVPTSGSRVVSPTLYTIYIIKCSGPGGSVENSTSVTVVTVIIGDFNLSLGGSVACNSVPLSWTAASGAQAYRILRGAPRVDISPYQPYTALNFTDTTAVQNTTEPYQIEAYNAGGTNRSNTINVTTPYCSPTAILNGTPNSIFQGQSSTLNWNSSYTTSCAASGAWSGAKAVSGSEIVIPSPPPSATYNLQCSGPGGSVQTSTTVNITELALPEFIEIIPR